MSLEVIGSRAHVHWLSDHHDRGTITDGHGVLYVVGDKLGQATADSYAGLTPGQVFERRYKGQKSSLKENFIASDIIVFDKIHGSDYDYDDSVRELVYDLYQKGRLPFSANFNHVQVENTNNEAMPGFDRDQHIDSLIDVVSQTLGLSVRYDTKDPIKWRWQQYEEAQQIVSTLRNHNLCLYAAYTSRGKTKISMEVATQLLQAGGLVLVTTPVKDTKKSFEDNINDFHFGNDRRLVTTYMDAAAFAKTSVADLKRRTAAGELIFVVLTVQDLRHGDVATKTVRKKYAALSGNLDLWIRDERHSQYNGDVTAERLADVRAIYELDLTATPYNVYNQYRQEQVVARTLLWGLSHREHTHLPQISITAIDTPVAGISPRVAALYSVDEGFDPRKLFFRQDGNFVMSTEIETLAERFYHSTLSARKNPLSIANDNLSDISRRCGMWVLPSGQDGDGARDYIPALAKMLNDRYSGRGTIYVDSYSVSDHCDRHHTAVGDYVEGLLGTNTRVIILTCGKFLTGTDIPALGHIVLFDKMSSIADFEQMMGRMIRQWGTPNTKERVKLYSLVPGHELQVVLGKMARANADLGGGTEWEVLDCVPLSEYTDTGVHRITANEILETVQEWCREQIRPNLPVVSLRHIFSATDNQLWQGIAQHYRRFAPKTGLTDDNGARVKVKLTAAEGGSARGRLDSVEAIIDTTRAMMAESQWIALINDTYDYRGVLQSKQMTTLFEADTVAAIMDSIRQSPRLETIVQNFLNDREIAYRGLPPEEFYDDIFINNDLKAKKALMFTPFTLVNEMIDNLPEE